MPDSDPGTEPDPDDAKPFRIRDERDEDHDAVREVHQAAFPGPEEAELVDRLRLEARPIISLVAERRDDARVIGHVLCSSVTIVDPSDGDRMLDSRLRFGLAPVGVLPAEQGVGAGSALVRAAVARCRELGAMGVVLLGDPGYYARFGFVAASTFGLVYEPVGEHPAFQALELVPGGFEPGSVKYHPAFDQV